MPARHLMLVAFSISVAFAQSDASRGSIGGVVRDAGTGVPMAGVPVSASTSSGQTVSTASDSQGGYVIRGLPPGLIRINAGGPPDSWARPVAPKAVVLGAGQDLQPVDMPVQGMGRVSGRITDADDQPIPGVNIYFLKREYALGALRYEIAFGVVTDKQGEYTRLNGATVYAPVSQGLSAASAENLDVMRKSLAEIQTSVIGDRDKGGIPAGIPIEAGSGFLVLAQKGAPSVLPATDAPTDPKTRKIAPIPTWFFGATEVQGAMPVRLAPRESREHVDIRMARGPSYCIQGTAPKGSGAEKRILGIALSDARVGFGPSAVMQFQKDLDDPETLYRVRICNLPAGDYRLTSYIQRQSGGFPLSFRTETVAIIDEDAGNVPLAVQSPVAVAGEVAWDGEAPDAAPASTLTIRLRPMGHDAFDKESVSAKVPIPGAFTLDNLLPDEYAVGMTGLPAGAYVKDVTYGGRSVLHVPLQAGSAAGLRFTLAHDGGTVSARVADADGHPVADAYVVVMPEGAVSEVALADTMVQGQTDLSGAWSSGPLAPGKYYVISSQAPVDRSPESMAKLVRSRSKAQAIEIGPGAVIQVGLNTIPME